MGVFLHYTQRFADLRWAGFLAQMFIRRTELPLTTKLSAENETPPIANVLLPDALLSATISALSRLHISCPKRNKLEIVTVRVYFIVR